MALEHISSYVPEEIQFDFKTGQPNGLLMYQSMYGGANRETFPDEHDFFAFTMQQGRLVFEWAFLLRTSHHNTLFRYALGEISNVAQPANVTDFYMNSLADSLWHHVKLVRVGKSATLTIDGRAENRAEATGLLALLDAKGPIYLGEKREKRSIQSTDVQVASRARSPSLNSFQMSRTTSRHTMIAILRAASKTWRWTFTQRPLRIDYHSISRNTL